jgi:GH15 family glucan-1,4-alpha-glucosidase
MPHLTPPIADHAAIGDCHSLALVAHGGSIDWFCPDVFSAPSPFAALLDEDAGGRFDVGCPQDRCAEAPRQQYLPRANVLRTRFATQGA